MKRVRCRERDVPANGCRRERTRIVIGSRRDPGPGGRAARCGAARKDLENDHAAAAARTRRAMIGNGVGIGCVVRCRRIDLRYWDGHQFPGARDVSPRRKACLSTTILVLSRRHPFAGTSRSQHRTRFIPAPANAARASPTSPRSGRRAPQHRSIHRRNRLSALSDLAKIIPRQSRRAKSP